MSQGNDLVLYLVLSAEFGGTRFGPFEGLEARLGSNKERCHITLPESLGVAKEHCKVIRQGGASMILAPSERTAAVFLWKGDARRPVQVQTPTAVKPGDSFSLVTPEGPRFFIELGELPADVKAQRSPANRARKNLTAGKFATAGKDLFLARLYTFSPISLGMRAWYFVKSGAIFQPRIIILGAIMMFGYLSTGVTACTAFKFRKDWGKATDDAAQCKENLQYAESIGSDVEHFAFDELAAKVTGSRLVGQALKKETALIGMVKVQARKIIDNPDQYEWMYEESNRSKDFADWRERVEKSEAFDPDTKRLLPYLAANRSRIQGKWDKQLDSKEAEVCGRGPVRMTYRQARNLGVSSVQVDAYVAGDATDLTQDEVARSQLLMKTLEAAGEPLPEVSLASEAEILRQGEHTCIHATGDDDRESLSKVTSVLEDQLGKKALFVPDVDGTFGAVARIAKFYASDLTGAKFVDVKKSPLDFSKKSSPAVILQDAAGGQWVLDRTAEIIAKAMVLPCEGVLNGDKAKMEATFGPLPSAVPCLVLNYRLTHEGS
jgi:hypothetical protein